MLTLVSITISLDVYIRNIQSKYTQHIPVPLSLIFLSLVESAILVFFAAVSECSKIKRIGSILIKMKKDRA